MTRLNSAITIVLSWVVATLTSKERLRQRLNVSLYRNALYLMTTHALTGGFGLVFWLVAARFYRAEDIGLASAAISAMMLLALLGTLGLDYALIRFLPNSGRVSGAMINSSLTLGGLASIIAALIFMAGLDLWSPALLFLRQHPVLFLAFVVFTAGTTLHMLVGRTFIAVRRAGFTLAQGVIFNVLRLVLVIILAAFFATFGILASWGLAAMAAVVIGVLLFLPRLHAGYRPLPVIKRKVVGELLHFSFTNYVTALLWFAPTFVLPLMVVNLLGAEANAYFYIAWAIANVLFAIPIATSFSLLAEGSHDEERLGRDTRRSLMFTFATVVPVALLIALVGDRVLLLFDPAYAENGTGLLRVLALSAVPLSLNHIYFGVKRVQMKMRGVVALSAFIAIATLALAWVLLPEMGILGAGIAWLSSQSVVALVIVILWVPRTGKRLRAPAAAR